jgi:hypothetical protein
MSSPHVASALACFYNAILVLSILNLNTGKQQGNQFTFWSNEGTFHACSRGDTFREWPRTPNSAIGLNAGVASGPATTRLASCSAPKLAVICRYGTSSIARGITIS